MPVSKRFLHPEAVSRIARLDLRARHIVEGFLSGIHRSPYFGQSVEFVQHREYTVGDDLRDLDWKVWAKHDRFYVKQYEEDTNLRCALLVDVSNSMRYSGGGRMSKFEYGATVAVSLAYLLLGQQDAVGLLAFDERVRSKTPQRTKRTHLNSLIQALSVSEPAQKTDLEAILREAANTYPRRGVMVIISDLLADRTALFKGIKLLRHRGHDVLVFHILDDDELDFDFNGSTRFEGLESNDFLNCNPRALREGYLQALNAYLDEVRRGLAQNSVDYALVRTSQPLDRALAAFVANRQAANIRRS